MKSYQKENQRSLKNLRRFQKLRQTIWKAQGISSYAYPKLTLEIIHHHFKSSPVIITKQKTGTSHKENVE